MVVRKNIWPLRDCEQSTINAELAELTEKCNHEDTKTRKVRWLSSCLRAFVVAFNNIKNFSAASAVSALNVRLPADRLAFGLLVEPELERRKVIEDGLGVHFSLAGERLERVGPRTGESHRQHRIQPP